MNGEFVDLCVISAEKWLSFDKNGPPFLCFVVVARAAICLVWAYQHDPE